ncbi:CHD3-type chromatin-remodeling factor PICKLE [Apostasia shenzhenica]|uniref:CHD3-type chromatin-remodeling factor PICKLE n=1 Tax=Apostasia shenzhenica TaxID=1088818 RepID=A0A2I0B4V4_9ASPA|nr:CHD3-type chromatin-remodeling factor PICKLE [Apostasia shenzhenica]
MREGSSLHDKMIDRNWVLKRKRKQITSGLDASAGKNGASVHAEPTKCSSTLRKKFKGGLDASRKIKGRDGYYFECEECDLGGNLLCCDSCPRTYHLDCLIPPLKRAPSGKWQCPKCCEERNAKPFITEETRSRQFRRKSTNQKAKVADSISENNIASHSGRSSLGSTKSSSKGKSTVTHGSLPEMPNSCADISSVKLSPSGDNVLRDEISTIVDFKTKKNAILPPLPKIRPKKVVNSCIKSLKSDGSHKLSKGKPDIFRSDVCDNNINIPAILSCCISKKNRKKILLMDKNKGLKSGKGKDAAGVSNCISGESSPSLEFTESPIKCNSSENQGSLANQKQEKKSLKSFRRKKLEVSSHSASSLSLELDGHGENAEKMTCDEILLDEVQQVDRILGCRVCGGSLYVKQAAASSCCQAENEENCSGRLETRLSSSEFVNQENCHQLDHCVVDCKILNVRPKYALGEGCQGPDLVALKTDGDSSNSTDVAVKGMSSVTSENNIKASFGDCMTSEVCELQEDSTPDVFNKDRTAIGVSEGRKSGEFPSEETFNEQCTPASSDLPIPSESQDNHCASKDHKSFISESVIANQSIEELRRKNNDSVTYEFLVKWVGKSNIHNSWVSEDQLKRLAKRKLENYKAKYGTAMVNICEDQWCQPQRIISLHESRDAGGEALVKWFGLAYDECTWEKLDETVVQNAFHLISVFKQFESQTLDNDARDDFRKIDTQEVVPLAEQPKELKGGSLFPHQLEALNWLRKCWHKSKNVILADEMGLGKTVSACSFISSLYYEFKVKLPCLVLVPLSTMPNWLAEFASWAPHLNVVEYHGCAKARSIIRQFEWHASYPGRSKRMTKSYKFNVLLTTYEMILVDSSHLRGVPWEVLVVDEGHRLKNSESKLFSLLNTFSFQHRVLLTGTPLQNNIGEMYNLLNFLQPSSFPSLSAFEEKFNDLSTAEKVEELKKLVAPHMLRRLKKDAMQNIPPKTERMVPVELTSIQAEYYRAMLTKNYQILRNIGKGVAQQSMLNIVMQLRKVCNHPYLIPGTEPDSGSVEFLQDMRIKASAKLKLLHSMLKILHKEGHRVLIFSQMTKLLDILEDYLTIQFGPGTFERVDGSVSVTDRQSAITRFNQDKSRFVFLLSTRSCGLGINLATADTVIIYDSDFNPHADIQAMNRAHRIGQSNRLLVYRLVVRASVEERILQLAKKKLMLDQLFVNKSGSQKEVEDILRWGTEELFCDCDSANGQDLKGDSIIEVDTGADREHKHRRRAGGLGDVYKDRCTDSGTKIVWDESAILKLLDRSNLQTTVLESADGDLENDMLGSLKSLDWNDEQLNEELDGTEMITKLAGDGCDPTLTKEENKNTLTEENEWDKLLRVRWETYQLEEEAVLGRGKRMRKAVSYKETFASVPSEALSESGNEEEEPQRDYSAAGRALKEKYLKLRARQKDRIARRRTMEAHSSVEGPALLMQSPLPSGKDIQFVDNNMHSEHSGEMDPSNNQDEMKNSQLLDAENPSYSSTKQESFSKHGYKRYHNNHLKLPARAPRKLYTDIIPPNNSQHMSSVNFSNDLSPVLGLCAPNASQKKSRSRVLSDLLNQPTSKYELKRKSMDVSEISSMPTASMGCLIDNNVALKDLLDSSILPDASGEDVNHRLKNIIPDYYFPFASPPLPTSGRCPSDLLENSDASLSSFRERLGLPNLVGDDAPPLNLAHPSRSSVKLQTDFLPNLSLSSNMKIANGCNQGLSNLPLAQSFGQHPDEILKQQQLMPDLPPMMGLGLVPTAQLLPENHRKLLDNIMMRTQTATRKFLKKRLKVDAWSEDELDALWIGVRRYGRGNWNSMLRDPKLKILRHRSFEELSSRWTEEQLKILDGPLTPMNSKSASFLGISDGMMTRALLGSKIGVVAEMPKFRSHLTDIKLGCGDFSPALPSHEPSTNSANENFPPLPSWRRDKSTCIGDASTPNVQLEHRYCHTTLSSYNGASSSIQQQNDVRNKLMKLPFLLDKSLNLLRERQYLNSGGFNMAFPDDARKYMASTKPVINDAGIPGTSKGNKLPHWLREAVSAPRALEPVLPPSVSAISQSVRLLYGEDKLKIPPFIVPGPAPSLPKDPRKRLKKKRKFHRRQQAISDNSNPKGYSDISSCSNSAPLMGNYVLTVPPILPSSIPPAPQLMQTLVSDTIPQTPPFSPPNISPSPVMMPSLIAVSPSMMPFDIPPLPQFKQSTAPEPPFLPSIPPVSTLLTSSILLSPLLFPSSTPQTPGTPCLSGLHIQETGSIPPSLCLNLNSPSSSNSMQGIQSVANQPPCPEVLPLVAPFNNHEASMSPPPEMTDLNYLNSEFPESKDIRRDGVSLIGNSKDKATNSHLGCEQKLIDEQVDYIDGKALMKTHSDLCLANDSKRVIANSSETAMAEDQRSGPES